MLTVGLPASDNSVGRASRVFPGRRQAALRVVVLILVVVALVTGAADLAAASDRAAVERDLAAAQAAAARIPGDLAAADVSRLDQDLTTLSRAGRQVQRRTANLTWGIAAHAGPGSGRSGELRSAAAKASSLAVAADALREADDVLGSEPKEADGSATLDALDELARAISTYASAVTRTADPASATLDRMAAASGLLSDLAGAQAPRTWMVCRSSAVPCTRVVISNAEVTSWRSARSPKASQRADIRVTGVDAAELFGAAGSGAHWDSAAAFRLLAGLRSPATTVHSSVPVEEWALTQLSRP